MPQRDRLGMRGFADAVGMRTCHARLPTYIDKVAEVTKTVPVVISMSYAGGAGYGGGAAFALVLFILLVIILKAGWGGY